jgi:hypothetical protein
VNNKNGGDFMAEEMLRYKKCAICKNEMEASDENFSKNRKQPDGLDKACRKCKSAEAKAYRARKKAAAPVGINPELKQENRLKPVKSGKNWFGSERGHLVDISPIIEKAEFHAGELKKISNLLEVLRTTTGADVGRVKLDLGVWG